MARPWILEYDDTNCTIAAAVGLIGDKWTFLILREAFNGRRTAYLDRELGLGRRPVARRPPGRRLARVGL